MEQITFIWNNHIHHGVIIKETPHGIIGMKTEIICDNGLSFNIYGKCQQGDCGPFNVLSITTNN